MVYIDESGLDHDMPRSHGYAPRGQRCIGSRDWHAKGRANVIAGLLAGAMLSVGLSKANVDADIFNIWLTTDLTPKLPSGSVWVMDRATFHRRANTKEAIEMAGHILNIPDSLQPRPQRYRAHMATGKGIQTQNRKVSQCNFQNPKLEPKLSRQAIQS